FPFRDGLDVVVDAGATCVAQPGGSMRDQEVIDAANERGVVLRGRGAGRQQHIPLDGGIHHVFGNGRPGRGRAGLRTDGGGAHAAARAAGAQ
ncbi:MAG: hypothetical protein E2603_26580, partial [Achromobacter sp.]|nr:hypothetical protein [Achromobacter sp.]